MAETIKRTALQDYARGSADCRKKPPRRLNVPFGIVDLSLAPTPGDGRFRGAAFWKKWGLRSCGCHGTTAGAGTAQRRGEKGRRDGVEPRRRPFRRVHPSSARISA
ncbi:MAG: DUF711 family protein [Christensenellales bacterium]